MWQRCELDDAVLKTTEDVTLWQTERGIVKINKDTLAVVIRQDDKQKGYVFHGHGSLLLDTIVETDEGAVGKPVEKELSEPFLVTGDLKGVEGHLDKANTDDLARMEYKEGKEFVANAEDLFSGFFKRGRALGCDCCGQSTGLVFAFANKTGEPDLLVLHGSKVVFKTQDMVFVADQRKTIMKRPEQTILTSHGKSFIVKG
jgi:hypothetical protein